MCSFITFHLVCLFVLCLNRTLGIMYSVVLMFDAFVSVNQNVAVQHLLQERSGRSTFRFAPWWRRSARNRKVHCLVYTNKNYGTPLFLPKCSPLMILCSAVGVSVVFESSREDYFPELMAWAAECGASCDGFEIANFADEGYGLKATRDIKVCVVL